MFKKKQIKNNNLEQKLRELRDQEIQSYEANLPRENDNSKTNKDQDAK